MNEFLWESTTPDHFLARFFDEHRVDAILATHTGIHWSRRPSEDRLFVNVGAIGRPANDGRTEVWYALLSDNGEELGVEFVPVTYDHRSLAREMADEGLPEEFIETILTGWWTTCNEILPMKERRRGRF